MLLAGVVDDVIGWGRERDDESEPFFPRNISSAVKLVLKMQVG